MLHLWHHHPDLKNDQLVRLLSDLRGENRQLVETIIRLRKANNRLEEQLDREQAVRFGRPNG